MQNTSKSSVTNGKSQKCQCCQGQAVLLVETKVIRCFACKGRGWFWAGKPSGLTIANFIQGLR